MKTKIFIMFFNVCFPCYDFPYVWERKEPLAMWMKTSKHDLYYHQFQLLITVLLVIYFFSYF